MKNAKILCTLGPSTDDKLEALVKAGLDGARLNLSHGTFEENHKRIKKLRKLCPHAFVVVDTLGPKMRLGEFESIPLEFDQEVVLSTAPKKSLVKGDIPVAFKKLSKFIKRKNTLLIEDGLVGLKVKKVEGHRIFCMVKFGSVLHPRKGINAPGVDIPFPYISLEDRKNIDFAIKAKVDYIADSFVRDKKDVIKLRKRIEGTKIKLISKIENFQGVNNFDEILEESDGIMVARGDLGVEMPIEDIPLLQKEMIRKANQVGKPIITATQMLDSMINNPRPTRAEANDVFNAVVDGTDCVMLSGETSIGSYPIETVQTMRKIVDRASPFSKSNVYQVKLDSDVSLISHSVYNATKSDRISAIIIPSVTGKTPRLISRFRINKPVYVIATSEETMRQTNILLGVESFFDKILKHDNVFEESIKFLVSKKKLKKGDNVVITSGIGQNETFTTNMIQITEV